MTPDQILAQAQRTFAEKGNVYGHNYLRIGEVLKGLFPDGITLKTVDDHNRFHLLMCLVIKLTRYTVNWKQGHQDSIHDAIVYAAILESLDLQPNPSPPRIPHLRRRPRKRLGHGR